MNIRLKELAASVDKAAARGTIPADVAAPIMNQVTSAPVQASQPQADAPSQAPAPDIHQTPLPPQATLVSTQRYCSGDRRRQDDFHRRIGQTVGSGKVFGVAVFKDGRMGLKEFVNSADFLKGSGPFFGYSTYTFEDGSITARYTGAAKDGKSKGEYNILSGTGVYANATGTGAFESVPNPFKGVNLYNVKLVIKTPGT
jgi:hypothetical protein